MHNAETTLVIFLSFGMAILLVMSIVVTTMVISLMRTMNRAASKLEAAADNIPGLMKTFGKRVGPAVFSAGMAMVARNMRKKRRDDE